MKFVLSSLIIILLSACQHQPVHECDTGSIYGYLRSEAHKDFLSKHLNDPHFKRYRSEDGGQSYVDTMVDYDHLKELYVCLTIPNKSPTRHEVIVKQHGIFPHALALAPGDILNIKNESGHDLSLFLAPVDQNDDRFEGYPTLAAGETEEFSVDLEGYLQLSADENESLNGLIWSVQGNWCKQLQSNDFYSFNELIPGAYKISFWYWRIGTLTHKLTVGKGQDVRMDEILSIDRALDFNRQDYYSGGVY